MALPTKPDMTHVWASGGAKVAPGNTKIDTGWTAEVPPFQWENWSQNRQDAFLDHINKSGFPVWDGLTNYEAAGQSLTKGSDGVIYKSVAASGPSTTVQDPVTDVSDTYWTVAFASVGAFLTQAAGDARYAQRANNLSDLTNAATARTNLGVNDAVLSGIAGSHSNLKLSATGLSALVTVTADSVCVKTSSNIQAILNNVNIPSLSLAASGANGLDTGTSSINTWYSVWVIYNRTTIAGLLSLSTTSPTMPSGYTYKCRVGWVKSDSNASNKFPLSFRQMGKRVELTKVAGTNVAALPLLAKGSTSSVMTNVSLSNFIPTTSSLIKVSGYGSGDATNTVFISPSTAYSLSDYAGGSGPSQAGFFLLTALTEILLQSMNIAWSSNSVNAQLTLIGWEDNL